MTNTEKPFSTTDLDKSLTNNEEISIWFDSYEELFSDFDPRSYSKRTLSNDFVEQVKKVAKDIHTKNVTLKLLMLDNNRNKPDEEIIAQRLHSFFKHNYEQLFEEKKKAKLKGITATIVGVLSMVISSYITFLKSEEYLLHLLQILFEPAGWFLLWMGLDYLIYFSTNTKTDLEFYAKMTNVTIEFGTY